MNISVGCCRTVFVGNVPDYISDAELAEYFCDVGEVLTVQIRGNDGGHYAFVEFAYPEQVEQVLDLATQQPFMLEGVMLRVQARHGKGAHQVMTTCCLSHAVDTAYTAGLSGTTYHAAAMS